MGLLSFCKTGFPSNISLAKFQLFPLSFDDKYDYREIFIGKTRMLTKKAKSEKLQGKPKDKFLFQQRI